MRRSWYERHPQSRRSLDRPVISVGNLSVGGSGKTPIVAALARMLLDMGQRPAILSRGYARRRATDGVVVVSDGNRVLEPVENSGDEPQMLARALPGVPVLVCADRHLAGRLAEKRFDATVMLLDDGFQHLALGRNVDVLVMPASDLDDAVLPSGRLREPLDSASSADCVLVPGSLEDMSRVAATFDRMPVFRVTNHFGSAPGIGRLRAVGYARRRSRRHRTPRALFHDASRTGIRDRPRAALSGSPLVFFRRPRSHSHDRERQRAPISLPRPRRMRCGCRHNPAGRFCR